MSGSVIRNQWGGAPRRRGQGAATVTKGLACENDSTILRLITCVIPGRFPMLWA